MVLHRHQLILDLSKCTRKSTGAVTHSLFFLVRTSIPDNNSASKLSERLRNPFRSPFLWTAFVTSGSVLVASTNMFREYVSDTLPLLMYQVEKESNASIVPDLFLGKNFGEIEQRNFKNHSHLLSKELLHPWIQFRTMIDELYHLLPHPHPFSLKWTTKKNCKNIIKKLLKKMILFRMDMEREAVMKEIPYPRREEGSKERR